MTSSAQTTAARRVAGTPAPSPWLPAVVSRTPGEPWIIDRRQLLPRLCIEPMLVTAAGGPLPLSCVLARLEQQGELAVPAKLTLSPAGVLELVAEVPRDGDRQACATQAFGALDTALRWFAGDEQPAVVNPAAPLRFSQEIQAAFAGLGWSHENDAAGRYQTTARNHGAARRLRAHPLNSGGVRVTVPALAVRVAHRRAARALALFALEANARLRLARLSVSAPAQGVVRVAWDCVLGGATQLAHWLEAAVEALVVACTETERAVRALATTAVAEAYLATQSTAAGAAI